MHGHDTLLLFLSFILFRIGQKAISAQSAMYETDVVVPQELRPDEVHLLQGSYRWSRGRRPRSDHQQEDHLFLRLPAFGKELYLQLQRDDSFLAEGFVTEERTKEGSVQHKPVLSVRQCFYAGTVLNHTDSFASLDACGGLTGLVQTEEERLFIEPVGQATDSFSGWEHRVIREKHSSSDRPTTAKDSSPKFCQTIRG
ncbi:A disintegrin and metalloproteinase with thrombospondin motifs 17-like [Cyprinus carpio]|uniref:A disintegrin and metalloproteinase with thrombospondin motifs 17-like n=1 Tax=Cyprinus carpio TaxID=7962 RepID=A0A9Q9UZH3_CYPCA|nr:A disintegrin and metalloproteinase with thrombospondin motifs 17-like [Cyprinus carpio]